MKPLTTKARASAAVLVGTLLVGSLAACGGGGQQAAPAADKSTLTIAVETDAAVFGYDPLKVSDGQRQFFEGLYEGLLELKADGSAAPNLASSFEYNADNTVLTLHLREDVTFTDGSKLDAELVKANFDRRSTAEAGTYAPIAKGGDQEVTSVDVVNPTTVSLTFAKPQPGFEKNLTSTMGMVVGKAGVTNPASLDTTPAGSGPYTLDPSTVKGNKYVMVKNDKHRESSEYAFNKVVFSPIADPQARANAIMSGQADVAMLASQTVDLVKTKGVGVSQLGGKMTSFIAFDKTGVTSQPFGNPKVREAINYAINREAFVEALHKGDLPSWNALPKDSEGYNEELVTKFAYNPEKAKSLLAEAGYPNGFEFDNLVGPETQTDMQALQKDLAAVGITMNLKFSSSTDEAFAAVATLPLGYITLNWDNPVGLMYGVILNGFTNVHGATDDQLSAFTGEAAAAQDDESRKAALKKLNTRLVESGWIMPVMEQLTNQGYNTKKIAPVQFAGANPYPILSSYKPAS